MIKAGVFERTVSLRGSVLGNFCSSVLNTASAAAKVPQLR
eukprot:SAG22_NODE_17795_length_298_cov_0.783920_2_plen_39_part_01